MSHTTTSPSRLSAMSKKVVPALSTLQWVGSVDGHLELIDQTLLPTQLKYVACHDVASLWEAIKQLRVRGAPAIGIAAAYGVCLGLQSAPATSCVAMLQRADEVAGYLGSSRPTAFNLFWSLDRMRRRAAELAASEDPALMRTELLAEARAIHEQDRQICRDIGRHGASLLTDNQGVLTHCNAGGLATADYGTALACFFAAHADGKRLQIYVDETRPLLQGARLTAWELMQHGIESTLICDSMAAQVMREGRVQAVITGADRIAANGDTANKIGTYGVAVLAAAHNIPFYVAAPMSTFDPALADGTAIPIEQRSGREITHAFGRETAPPGVRVYNPAFDVTPAHLIKAIICEHGIIEPVTRESIAAMLPRT